MRPIPRYQTVEIVVAAGFTGFQVNFDDVPDIRSDGDRDALVSQIAISSAEVSPLCPSGNTNATLAQIQNANLTLYCLGANRFFKIPLARFLSYRNNANTFFSGFEIFETQPLRIDWTKSYVAFNSPPAPVAQFSFLFEFGYDWYPPNTYQKYLANLDQLQQQGIIKV